MSLRNYAILVVSITVLFTAPASAQQYFLGVIRGTQEVPPNGSTALGLGCYTLNSDGTLDYEISFSGLSSAETGAHIHGPAPIGVNAGVQFALPLGSPKIGTLGPLTAPQVTDLSNGFYYVNIHTTLYPGGEIRGQIFVVQEPCSVPNEERTWGSIKEIYKQ